MAMLAMLVAPMALAMADNPGCGKTAVEVSHLGPRSALGEMTMKAMMAPTFRSPIPIASGLEDPTKGVVTLRILVALIGNGILYASVPTLILIARINLTRTFPL
jgi:hypothetical protein